MEGVEPETPGQRAARLRREKRQNKAAGEERLAKIKQLNGGIAPPEEALGGPAQAQADFTAADPDEADIASTAYAGNRPSNQSTVPAPDFTTMTPDQQMHQALLRMQAQQGSQPQQRPLPQGAAGAASDEDPMAKLMQQFMGMAGGDPADPNNIHNTQDPMQMLSAMMGAAQKQGQGQAASQATSSSIYMWRIVHSIFAVILAGYIAMTSTFDGSLLARTQSLSMATESSGLGHRLFVIFISAELGLQSVRFFLEGGQLQGSGILASISQIAPEPWAGYVRAAGRWISILGSVFSDAMVVIFVLGLLAWWNGSAAS